MVRPLADYEFDRPQLQGARAPQASGTNRPSSSHINIVRHVRRRFLARYAGRQGASRREPPVGPATTEAGAHPVPFRTRKLSPPSPRVLRGKPAGGQGVAGPTGGSRRCWDPRVCEGHARLLLGVAFVVFGGAVAAPPRSRAWRGACSWHASEARRFAIGACGGCPRPARLVPAPLCPPSPEWGKARKSGCRFCAPFPEPRNRRFVNLA